MNNNKLPDGSNMYGIINSTLSKEEIARKFGKIGWRISKAAWYDWELINDKSELIIDGDNEILIHGLIVPDYFDEFVESLKTIELKCSLELYDENQQLMKNIET